MTDIRKIGKINYMIRYPETYAKGEKYPTVTFFHGAGGRGDDMGRLAQNPFFTYAVPRAPEAFVTVAPLCPENAVWFDVFEDLLRLTDEVREMDFCDKNAFYAVGASMGGYCTWQMAMSRPDVFAAVMPICGGGMYWNAARMREVPAWAHHGAEDTTVLPEESKKMVEAVLRAGGNARLSVYEGVGHNSWINAYSDPATMAWLLSNRK